MQSILVIGAGPAGLTAAYKLLQAGDVRVTVLEESRTVGGISRTVNVDGDRMDLGGHRFFSKDEQVTAEGVPVSASVFSMARPRATTIESPTSRTGGRPRPAYAGGAGSGEASRPAARAAHTAAAIRAFIPRPPPPSARHTFPGPPPKRRP